MCFLKKIYQRITRITLRTQIAPDDLSHANPNKSINGHKTLGPNTSHEPVPFVWSSCVEHDSVGVTTSIRVFKSSQVNQTHKHTRFTEMMGLRMEQSHVYLAACLSQTNTRAFTQFMGLRKEQYAPLKAAAQAYLGTVQCCFASFCFGHLASLFCKYNAALLYMSRFQCVHVYVCA